MNWKFVLNGNLGNFKNPIEVSILAGKAGYKFFLYKEKVYYRNDISLCVSETGITDKDLF